ncbi:MAG TPA: arsenosugar biosynthesis radical SAM (seleno)protein ArsS [Vicinamibacteria bacterium]|nr:arsenosugar biosynthesis radical SAM (seleno)protein ArsS [Vicinamibacteria bacterium]
MTTLAPPSRFLLRVAGAVGELRAARPTTLQLNVGKRCNQACRHCHVDASPLRTEVMADDVVEACLAALAGAPALDTLDITGGAPELHPRFREMVEKGRALGRKVMVRHNLTVQFEPGQEDLPSFFAGHEVEVVSSLPHYTEEATDRQRGHGVFGRSIEALRRLNAEGYGCRPGLVLNLVSNPVGAFLPPAQEDLERDTREWLLARHEVVFNALFTITNMPIARFESWLRRSGTYESYLERLEAAFNPGTVANLMCRHLVSVGYDGRLHDCDFNQMLEMGLEEGRPATIFDFDFARLAGRGVRTGEHCFGCTAGTGSSCGGAIA